MGISGLLSRDLYRGNYVRVTTFRVTRIYGSSGIAIRSAVAHRRIGVQRSGVQQGIDLGKRPAGARIYRAIDIVAGNIRGTARSPRQVDAVRRGRCAGARGSSCGRCRLCVACKCKCRGRGPAGLGAEGNRERRTLTRWKRQGKRKSAETEC